MEPIQLRTLIAEGNVALEVQFLIFSFIFGTCLGSFLQACAYRIPRGISIVHPGSSCPHCNNKLKWYQNLPVMGYLWQQGKCLFCLNKISPQYLIVEIIMGCFSALCFYCLNYELLSYLQLMGLATWLFILALIDQEHGILPDSLTVTMLLSYSLYLVLSKTEETGSVFNFNSIEPWALMMYSFFVPWIIYRGIHQLISLSLGSEKFSYDLKKPVLLYTIVLAFCILFLFYIKPILSTQAINSFISFLGIWFLLETVRFVVSKIAKQEALGRGDIKLISCLALMTGFIHISFAVMLMSFLATLVILIQKGFKRDAAIRLGPYIASSVIIVELFLDTVLPI